MRIWRLWPGLRWLLPIVSLTLLGCKLDIDARIKGNKPGSTSIMLVHVKSKANAYINCSPGCFSCTSFTMPNSGEFELEIDLSREPPAKQQVCLTGKAGLFDLFKGDVTLPGPAPTMEVSDVGIVSCNVKKCLGSVGLLPAPGFGMSADPGVVVEVAGRRFTMDQHGYGRTTIDVALSPGVKDLTLAKLCAKEPTRMGATQVVVTFPDGAKVSREVPITTAAAYRSVSDALKEVDKGPVLLPWEAGGAAPTKGKRAAIVLGSECSVAGSPQATLADAAVVVLITHRTRIETCEYVTITTNTKTGERRRGDNATGKLTLYDVVAAAYDRFSGKVLATKTFLAPKKCEEKMGAIITDQISHIPESAVVTWAGSL